MQLVVVAIVVLVVGGLLLTLRARAPHRTVRRTVARTSPLAGSATAGSIASGAPSNGSMAVGPSVPRPPSGALVSPLPSMAPDPDRVVARTRSSSAVDRHAPADAAAASPRTATVPRTPEVPQADSRRVPVSRTKVPRSATTSRPASETAGPGGGPFDFDVVRGAVPGPLGPSSTVAPAPGWFPDPEDPTRWRWWDGARWTDHRS